MSSSVGDGPSQVLLPLAETKGKTASRIREFKLGAKKWGKRTLVSQPIGTALQLHGGTSRA